MFKAVVLHLEVDQLVAVREAEQAVALQPAQGRAGAVELVGSEDGGGQFGNGPVDGQGQKFAVLVQSAVVEEFQYAELVAAGQVQLQCLGQIGDLALFFRQGHGQAQKVPGQFIADEMDLFPDQLQVLQALLRRGKQVVQLDDGVIQLPGHLADIGHGQLAHPAAKRLGTGVAEGKTGGFLFRDSKVGFQNLVFHECAPMSGCLGIPGSSVADRQIAPPPRGCLENAANTYFYGFAMDGL